LLDSLEAEIKLVAAARAAFIAMAGWFNRG
jgi:hypothetical protein